MKIIFLDIDGVLNVYPQGSDKYGSKFHTHFMDNLKIIVEKTDAKIVISSTWRMAGLDEMQDMWKHRNLAGEVIDITPNHMVKTGSTLQRGKEIQEWLEFHPEVVNYIILDDDTDMEEYQMNNFVQCSDNQDHEDCVDNGYGLTTKCAEKAIEILNGK